MLIFQIKMMCRRLTELKEFLWSKFSPHYGTVEGQELTFSGFDEDSQEKGNSACRPVVHILQGVHSMFLTECGNKA